MPKYGERLPKMPALLRQLWRDPNESTGLLWAFAVNGLAASWIVPARVRTVLYRLLGLEVHITCLFKPGVVVRSRQLSAGRGTAVNVGVVFDNRVAVRLGERVGVGINVVFATTGHDISAREARAGRAKLQSIEVGDGAYIGSNAVIVGGSTIGAGAVIAAGSVVIRPVRPHTLVGGVPARELRKLE